MFLLDLIREPLINPTKALALVALAALIVLLVMLWKKK